MMCWMRMAHVFLPLYSSHLTVGLFELCVVAKFADGGYVLRCTFPPSALFSPCLSKIIYWSIALNILIIFCYPLELEFFLMLFQLVFLVELVFLDNIYPVAQRHLSLNHITRAISPSIAFIRYYRCNFKIC